MEQQKRWSIPEGNTRLEETLAEQVGCLDISIGVVLQDRGHLDFGEEGSREVRTSLASGKKVSVLWFGLMLSA
jgi:hypothetical protein